VRGDDGATDTGEVEMESAGDVEMAVVGEDTLADAEVEGIVSVDVTSYRSKKRAAAEMEKPAMPGKWCLLEPSTPASPICGYKAGKYKKMRSDGNVWLRADDRNKFPPIEVKYTSTLEGETSSLALPIPRTAFVPVSHVRSA